MKLSQKKTCEGCRAQSGSDCALNFATRSGGAVWKPRIPTEPCYKPRTYDEYMTARRWQQEELGVDTSPRAPEAVTTPDDDSNLAWHR